MNRLPTTLRPIRSAFSMFSRGVATFLFPRLCPCCLRRLSYNTPPICGSCMAEMPRFHADEVKAIDRLNGTQVFVDRIDAMFLYERDNSTSRAIRAFKFAHDCSVGRYLALLACQYFDWSPALFDCIVPVPLHTRKQGERGFNQAEVIAQVLSDYLGIPICRDAVVRHRLQTSQTRYHGEERRRRLIGSFRPTHTSTIPLGAKILVVDDVITTGSTLRAVIDALGVYSPASIRVFTLAVDV